MAKCYLYDIADPAPTAFTETHWIQLFREMRKSGWYGIKGKRMGFVNVIHRNGQIGGYFANEGKKKGVQYDENKEQVDPPPFYSFEHLFFVLFEDTAQLLLQSRNIYDYIDLGLPVMRDNFLRLLADLFRLLGIHVAGDAINLKSAGITYTQEQLYSIFTHIAQVTELEISGLHETALPPPDDPRYKLFNPKEEWDEITWGAVADTLKLGLDRVAMSSVESPESTLQAPIPKAFAGAGEIDKITGYDKDGQVVIRHRTENDELEIDLPVRLRVPPEILDHILKILNSRGRVENWQVRQQQRQEELKRLNRGTLFEGLE